MFRISYILGAAFWLMYARDPLQISSSRALVPRNCGHASLLLVQFIPKFYRGPFGKHSYWWVLQTEIVSCLERWKIFLVQEKYSTASFMSIFVKVFDPILDTLTLTLPTGSISEIHFNKGMKGKGLIMFPWKTL